ncbi:XRE family transcriptional regulator [Novosphingobium cyanobacteriorum]|uniref:LexA family transcriptional regulator n=1 Tax=Novosphingobium cyanobacteriorum TaxID=3024215 RepID=A0ABT6CNQ7_9SPHN|nr:LexA family transcriptional regulator [Novosphingobium cyanobacteriorum]MDF8335544.1 LexA family transcriptional regulator [Novosphingobium cyanobacteriorum]
MVERDRLLDLLLERGVSQAEVARRIGVSAPGLWKLVHNRVRKSKHLERLAEELETTPEFLLGKTDDPAREARVARLTPETMGHVLKISEWDLSESMEGRFLDLPLTGTEYAFSSSWLRLFTKARASQIYLARQFGDSMSPTIACGDQVLIDTADNHIAQSDQIWALVFEGTSQIRRIRPAAEGKVEICADNAVIRPLLATREQYYIVGRIVTIMHRLMPGARRST